MRLELRIRIESASCGIAFLKRESFFDRCHSGIRKSLKKRVSSKFGFYQGMLKYWFAVCILQKESVFRIQRPNYGDGGELSVCVCVCRCHRCWICCVRLHCSVWCLFQWMKEHLSGFINLVCAYVLFVCCWVKLKLWISRNLCICGDRSVKILKVDSFSFSLELRARELV